MRSYKVYSCHPSRDLALETCSMVGNFRYPSSALARLAECNGSRAWIQKTDRDVTEELLATASPGIREVIAEKILSRGMVYGRAKRR